MEGVDIPRIDAIVMARPTLSKLTFKQMVSLRFIDDIYLLSEERTSRSDEEQGFPPKRGRKTAL